MVPRILLICFLLSLAVLIWLGQDYPGTSGTDSIWTGDAMGTTFNVQVADCSDKSCAELETILGNRLEELEQQLSHYRPDSELSAFNQYAKDDWFAVSSDLATIVEYALELSRVSNGAFDITVAPAVDAWGFGPTNVTESPDAGTVKEARNLIGYEQLSARISPAALRKTDPGISINLSALAKGYAVDQLALLLESLDNNNYLVEIGGEVRTSGFRPDGKPWRIGIEPPDGGLSIDFIVAPGQAAVATSGDYRNFYIENGTRISHTIDPDDATPVNNALSSVSVIAPSAMQADALATLFMVLGAEQSQSFAAERDIALLMFIRGPDDLKSISNAEFDDYLISK